MGIRSAADRKKRDWGWGIGMGRGGSSGIVECGAAVLGCTLLAFMAGPDGVLGCALMRFEVRPARRQG
jgi:hypothetical protein